MILVLFMFIVFSLNKIISMDNILKYSSFIKMAALVTWCALTCLPAAHALLVGVGIADVTGPPAEIGFMGYAKLEQVGHGIHLRQFARAFVLEDDKNEYNHRIVFVSVDAAMMGIGVRREVIRRLHKRFGNIYNETNVILSGTHTHSTPGGFLMDFLFDLPILGFSRETYNAYISGIYRSIVLAHNNMAPAKMMYGETEILDANINRSPTSYLRNPPEERSRYKHDVDKTLAQVRFVNLISQKVVGVINWFAVHPTSMNNTNRLISSDNVGYASILMEKALNGNNTLPGRGNIVCAFASTNLGDVSPNTKGPRCEFSGKVCDQEHLLCKLPKEQCFASGPGSDMFESTKIIATRLFEGAMKVLNSPGEDLTGPLNIAHQYVAMPEQQVSPYDPVTETFNSSVKVSGCLPAMGYSFAAGTTDGPGAFDFQQGTTTSNPLWNAVRDFIAEPSKEDIKCQAPKPILLATGRAKFPYQWQPKIVSCSVAQIGGLFLAAVPGEFTTMSGRRLRNVIWKASGAKKVVLAGLSNIYSDYIATPEEYQAQRYEAASTIFGPHTLDIYLNKYVELTKALVYGKPVDPGPEPPDFSEQLITLIPPVLWDGAPWGKEFGDCVQQPDREYSYGDTVQASFVAGHPRNGLRHGRWYAAVEKLESEEDDSWTIYATDADWETKFIWRRDSKILGTSYADIEWEIPLGTPRGTYRIHHYGNYKYILGGIYHYHGFSRPFDVK
ncbi:neutral ceramidase isoform X1 [Pectinophora gossypiella]|uniref:neutral ceramidase isoform X1 n=2 Tax=Pectinophora gossypiella TaxID=13191 RepID=UPI00214F3472|nr:neutral ceramidase isoform X1 [Pectinophora gossypiella]XP_049868296.1 neutral ceramidase isoform X1 [Pectinophora gossypiella]XP_049868297.1 neutral ceramidase isoform X1 [Pectinophora gossypiella]